jgi:hypothetical protein
VKERSIMGGKRARLLSLGIVRIVISGRVRAGVRGDEEPLAANSGTQEYAPYGPEALAVQKEQGTKLLDELKGLVDSLPQDRRKQIIAALKEIFSELDGGAAKPAPRGV